MNHLKSKWLYCCALIIVLLSGCDFNNLFDTDIKSVRSSPTLALPLGYGSMGIQDLLSDEDSLNIKVYADGPDKDVLYLSYEQTLRSQAIKDLLTLTNKNLSRGLVINPTGVSVPVPANSQDQQLIAGTLTYDLDFNPEKFDEILFDQGSLQISVQTSPLITNLQFEAAISLPTFTLNNVPLQRTLLSGTSSQQISIAGYKAALNDNLFDINVSVAIKAHNQAASIPPGTRLNVTLAFNNVSFDYVIGFFGDQTADLPTETLEIGAFDNVFDDVEVSIANPKISFEVVNEYGIPVNVIFNSLEARNASGKLNVTLSPSSPIAANFPTTLGDSAFTNVSVTNAKALLDFEPTSFFYDLSARINQNQTSGTNFCSSDAELKVRMSVEVPLIGHASDIVISDTTDIDLGDVKDSDIESATLKINATNGIPLNATLQIFMLTENFQLIDVLLANDQEVVKGATTDATGTPVSPGVLNEEIIISKDKINKLLQAKKLIISSRLQTADNPKDVRFRVTDKIDVKLGLLAKLNLKVDL
jgi:hypothetical protein